MASEAKTKIVIDVGEGAKSLRTLKQEFKETQKELDNTIVGTKEYTAAIKKLANVKDEIEDLNKEITAFRPDQKLQAFIGVGRGLAAGFEGATAAAALFGGEAKEVEKAMLKVQATMALANAVQEVGELAKSFQLLGGVIKAAFMNNPFTVMLVALAAIGTALYAFIKRSDEAAISSDSLTKSIDAQNKAFESSSKAIDTETDKLKLLANIHGDSEETIRKIEENSYKKKLELAKKNEKLAEADVIRISNQSLEIKQTEEYAKSMELAGNALSDARAKRLEAENQLEIKGLQNQKAVIDEGAAKRKEDEQKKKEDADKALAAAKRKEDDLLKLAEENYQRALAARKQFEQDELLSEQLYNARQTDTEVTADDELAALQAQKLNASLAAYEQNKQDEIALAKEKYEAKKILQIAEFDAAQQTLTALEGLFAQNQDVANALFVLDKALAISKVIVNTQAEISAYWANPVWSAEPDGGVTIKTAASIAAGIRAAASVGTIVATTLGKFGGGGSGGASTSIGSSSGGGGGGRPPQLNQVGNTSTNLSNINQGQGHKSNDPIKAYMVESEATATQEQIARIKKRTKF